MLNLIFWFALINVIILPSLRSLTIFIIPTNLKLTELEPSNEVINSRGNEARRSIKKSTVENIPNCNFLTVVNFLICMRIFIGRSEVYYNIKHEDSVNNPIDYIHINITRESKSKFIWNKYGIINRQYYDNQIPYDFKS